MPKSGENPSALSSGSAAAFEEGHEHENERSQPAVTVHLVRHGSTSYLEDDSPPEEKENLTSLQRRDLTDQGIAEITEYAKTLVAGIKPANSIVVLWSSPAWRAQGSESIIKEALETAGIEVVKLTANQLMRPFDKRDRKSTLHHLEATSDRYQSADAVYARAPIFQSPHPDFESQPEVVLRSYRILHLLQEMASHVQTNGKELHIIAISHFEFINPVMEELFGYRVEDGQGIQKSEDMSISFQYDQKTEVTRISATFRAQTRTGLILNDDSFSLNT